MSYQICITATAECDIVSALDYIEYSLKNPATADNLLSAITKQLSALADFPQKCKVVDDLLLAFWGIRFVTINNYLAFYVIDEEKQIVNIVRFLYRKGNWKSILQNGIPNTSGKRKVWTHLDKS